MCPSFRDVQMQRTVCILECTKNGREADILISSLKEMISLLLPEENKVLNVRGKK